VLLVSVLASLAIAPISKGETAVAEERLTQIRCSKKGYVEKKETAMKTQRILFKSIAQALCSTIRK
jgi:hypothetical protein